MTTGPKFDRWGDLKVVPSLPLFLFVCGLGMAGLPGGDLIERPVGEFAFPAHPDGSGHWSGDATRVGLPEAVRALAHHTETKIVVERLPDEFPVVPVSAYVKESTVGATLELLLEQDSRYEAVPRRGIIEVRPKGAEDDPLSCLNLRIPKFHVSYNWFYAFFGLRLRVDRLNKNPADDADDPIAQVPTGYSGPGAGLCPPRTVVEESFEGATVREILNALAAEAGNVAWVIGYKESPRVCENMIWGSYQPATCYSLFEVGPDSVEGLPPRCRNCHYHRR